MPWDQGFPEDRESYRSRARTKKRKEQEASDRFSKLESMVSHLHQQVDEMREHRQLQEGAPTGGPSQLRSSVASTGVGADEPSKGTYPVDYITEKTTCELHEAMRNLSAKAAEGYALPCESTALYLGNEIPDGYARVGVDQVHPGFETLKLHIPGGDDERILGDVQGGLILWPKKHIVIPGWTAPRPPSPPSPHDDDLDDHHSTSPSRSSPPPHQTPHPSPPLLPQQTPQPSPPPPPPTRSNQSTKTVVSALMGFRRDRLPVPRQEPLPKVPKVPPPRPWERTVQENAAAVAADVKRQMAPKKPPPKQVYTGDQKKWATDFINHPSQVEINRKDDYARCLGRISSSKTTSTSDRGKRKRDVAQLGAQSKQLISPLKVTTDKGSTRAANTDKLAYRAKFAAEAGMSLSQLDADELPTFLHVDKWTWEYGKSLVPRDQIEFLPTQLRRLHDWYMDVTKEGRLVLVVQVTEEHHTGKDEINVYLEELYQLYQLDSLDLSIVSTYCL